MNEIAPASPASEPRRVRHGLIEDWRDAVGILFLLLVAAFFGALITRFWPETEEAADIEARLGTLETRLAADPRELTKLKDRVAKLESRLTQTEAAMAAGAMGSELAATAFKSLTPGAGPTPGSAVAAPPADPASKLIADLGTRLTALEAKTATTPDDVKAAKDAIGTLTASLTEVGGKIDGIAERLTKIESSDLLEMARRASLATAIANLSRAAQGSAPFKQEYDVAAALVPGDARVAAIAPLAARGVPTASTLIASFGNLADAALDAERIAKSEGWWSRIWANLMSLVSARTVGETDLNTNEGRLARAEVRLAAGDLAAAVKELNAVDGDAREPLKVWLGDAKARLDLEATLADLNTRAIEALASPTSAATDDPVPQGPAP